MEVPRRGRVKTYASSIFGLKYPLSPVCPWVADAVCLGYRLWGWGVWGSALPHQSKAWPAPSPTHLHLKLFQDLSLSSLSCFQVCFLGCALLQSVHFKNERPVRPLPLDRKRVGIWYINIQTNTCDHSSKTGEYRKPLKRDEMPFRSWKENGVWTQPGIVVLLCISSPFSVYGGTDRANFWCKGRDFCYTQERVNMTSQIWLCSKLTRLPLSSSLSALFNSLL